MTNFSNRNAINTTKWYNLQEDKKIVRERKYDNKNNQKIALNDINEADHISFKLKIRLKTKTFICRRFFKVFQVFESRKYSEEIEEIRHYIYYGY